MDKTNPPKVSLFPRAIIFEKAALVALLLLILFTVYSMYKSYGRLGYDRIAENDYRKLRAAVFNAVANRQTQRRILFTNQQGPYTYPLFLSRATLSPDVRASVFHQTKRRKNNRPITVTRIEVYHILGSSRYVLTEVNGIALKQVIELQSEVVQTKTKGGKV